MLLPERADFERMLAELFGALGHKLTEEKTEGFWKGLAAMSLTEFARCRDYLLRQLESGESPRALSVGTMWQAKRALRATGPTYQHQRHDPDAGRWDDWATTANHHLLAYVRCAVAARPRRYGDGGISGTVGPGDRRPSAAFERNIARLVAAKNAWATDMRDLAVNAGGEVPVAQQREIWDDYLRRAEAEISAAAQHSNT